MTRSESPLRGRGTPLALPLSLTTGLALALGSGASAQDISWATFSKENARLAAPSALVENDPEEKDYAWGDLDQDGDVDLVIVRKQPFTSVGHFPNVLLMNEGGVLTDRTAQYASATDVPGDQGFLTPTNDRDVAVVDVDLDGWLDVVTATTLSINTPKSISHPRVYMNLGDDGAGNWLGLHYEEARIPDMGQIPRFCGLGAGDVTGDGYPDLYFSDYDSGQAFGVDLNDKLLINDGTGHFVDESLTRMTSTMLASAFGTSAVMDDLNGDGLNEIIDGESGSVKLNYNDPNNPGNFVIQHTPYSGAPYHVNTGDLNNDGKADLVISDDGQDRYLLNTGNDALGRVIWSAPHTYDTDDGFASDNLIIDLDGDGWNDALYADADVDIPGCGRRMHIRHNRGGTVGGFVSIVEEDGAGWTGVTGMTTGDQVGMHDIAVFDIDGDGDNDLVLGRCVGTDVWINQAGGNGPIGTPYCDPATANSTGQPGRIEASGSPVVAVQNFELTALDLPQSQFGYFLTSATQGLIQNPGGSQGDLCLGGQIGRFVGQVQNSGIQGQFSISVDLTQLPSPVSQPVLAGQTWNFTCWYRDLNPSPTSNFTDALEVTFQ